MADAYRIRIDLKTLRSNLSRARGSDMPEEEMMEWLEYMGFERDGDEWVCEDISLDALAEGEVLTVEQII